MSDKTKPVDLSAVRPFGSSMDDGRMQLSFTLPVPNGPEAQAAARDLAEQMGLLDPAVTHSADIGGYTFFIVYGKCAFSVDMTKLVVPKIEGEKLTMDEFDRRIEKLLGRRLVAVGACIGDDAHTVGIDAIMNMKGYAHHYGLERYRMIDAYNLGAQISAEDLVDKAIEFKADAVLAGQVVTERDFHRKNLSELSELLEASGIRDNVVAVCGGPRITHELALELGFDAGFGPGTFADDVASFIFHKLKERGKL